MRVSPVNSYGYTAPTIRKAVNNQSIEESTGSIAFKGGFFKDLKTVVKGTAAFFSMLYCSSDIEIPEEIERSLPSMEVNDYGYC